MLHLWLAGEDSSSSASSLSAAGRWRHNKQVLGFSSREMAQGKKIYKQQRDRETETETQRHRESTSRVNEEDIYV